jgi:hypothetical protein
MLVVGHFDLWVRHIMTIIIENVNEESDFIVFGVEAALPLIYRTDRLGGSYEVINVPILHHNGRAAIAAQQIARSRRKFQTEHN